MSKTLRRSCAACAKAKHRCDLRTPKCSRCVKRNCNCTYANEPLTSRSPALGDFQTTFQNGHGTKPYTALTLLDNATGNVQAMSFEAHLFDPFDSYPSVNLPRLRVQGLMQHFLSKIAFQYYPLDLNPASNPFVVSWWPLALTDPALFHVTLQTASLDAELKARNGFPHSDILMKDSVSLLRHKIEDRSLAFQAATMNAVVTLAAIEHGKGNIHVSKMHIDAVKRMVAVRGGLSNVKETSPLTARMVPWVSMLVIGSPQFEAQDDFGHGDGVCVIPQWTCDLNQVPPDPGLIDLSDLDSTVQNIFVRLRAIFGASGAGDMPDFSTFLFTTDLHDLTCYVLHRLLRLPPFANVGNRSVALSECVRYGTAIYMFIVHGPTYYSHAVILNSLLVQLKYHLGPILSSDAFHHSLLLWLLSVGTVASVGTNETEWFHGQAAAVSLELGLRCWEDVEVHLKRALWLQSGCRVLFQQTWKEILASNQTSQTLPTEDVGRAASSLEHGGETFGV